MMRTLSPWAAALAMTIGWSAVATAHDPPGTTFPMWQWPTSALPVLDGQLWEWEVIPDEYWLKLSDLNNGAENSDTIDPLDYNVRFVFAWNDELDRIYLAWEAADDYWSIQRDYVEIAVDADHSGGPLGSIEQEGEAAPTQANGQAQATRLYLNGQEDLAGVPSWNWHWLTQADWYREQPYSHGCFVWSEPQPGEEYTWQFEMYHVWWDAFSPEGPQKSVQHDFIENQIIGLSIHNRDGDVGQCCGEETGEVLTDWRLSSDASSENADFFSDWVLLPVDDFGVPTIIEDYTWGHIKASFRR